MFEKGKFYSHTNAHDLDIFVLDKYENSDSINLTIGYIFKSNKRLLQLDFVTIKKSDFEYWEEIEYE